MVRAPADGYVTNLALRKGARVANLPLSPVMAFIDTSETIIGVEIAQIDARYVAAGPAGRGDLQVRAGQGLYRQGRERAAGDRDRAGADIGRGRRAEGDRRPRPSSCASSSTTQAFAERLPAGSTGDAAIFTDHVKAAHVIRKVLLRQIAILNYINPF